MRYKLTDAFEAGLGAITSLIFFAALRSGEPGPFFNPTAGLIMTSFWLFILFKELNKGMRSNFFFNVLVVSALSVVLSIVFNLATWEQMNGFEFFGGPAAVMLWMGIVSAVLYDKFNIRGLLSTKYVRR